MLMAGSQPFKYLREVEQDGLIHEHYEMRSKIQAGALQARVRDRNFNLFAILSH